MKNVKYYEVTFRFMEIKSYKILAMGASLSQHSPGLSFMLLRQSEQICIEQHKKPIKYNP